MREVNDEVKLRALEEYEKIREAISLQNVFENHNQIKSNFKLRLECDSSQVILPILPVEQSKKREVDEAWIIDTGNLVLSNEKGNDNDNMRCAAGYNPINLDLTQIQMAYTDHLQAWKSNQGSSKKVLKDLNIRLIIMIRDDSTNKGDQQRPLMQFKAHSTQLKLVFDPITFVHLANIGQCFKARSKELTNTNSTWAMKEKIRILRNAQVVYRVKKKGGALSYWDSFVAVLSGSYIYFYSPDDAELLKDAITFLQQPENDESESLSQSDEDLNFRKEFSLSKDAVGKLPLVRNLDYLEYFLVKGCTKIQSYEEYKIKVKNRASVLSKRPQIRPPALVDKNDDLFQNKAI